MRPLTRLLFVALTNVALSQAFGRPVYSPIKRAAVLDVATAGVNSFTLPILPSSCPDSASAHPHGPPRNLPEPGGSNWTAARPVDLAPAGAGAGGKKQTRIIDGLPAVDLGLFPYVAYVQHVLSDGGSFTECTGSLVAAALVLTAAHCLVQGGSTALASQLQAWVGGVWHDVVDVFVHPGYADRDNDWSTASNDIAMLALAIPSSQPTVALPTAAAPAVADVVWTAGFGITENGRTSDSVRYTSLEVFDSDDCPPGFIDNFCAGGTSGYTCTGDSGGPVVVACPSGDVLVGLTSWGPDDCYAPYSYYVRVSDHLETIGGWMLSSSSRSDGGSGSGGGSVAKSVDTTNVNSGFQQWLACLLTGKRS